MVEEEEVNEEEEEDVKEDIVDISGAGLPLVQ